MEYEHSQSMAIDFRHIMQDIRSAFVELANDQKRPSILFKPKLAPDGNMWIALYGENLQEGIAGCGETPEKAMINFDINFLNQKLHQGK
jgi:hypothetical protein